MRITGPGGSTGDSFGRLVTLGLVGLIGALGLTACTLPNSAPIQDLPFERPLRVPDLVQGQERPDGTRHYDLTVDERTHEFGGGRDSQAIGINSTYLGPTLLMRRGDTVSLDVNNNLDERTTLHWHGMHVPARMDGGPHQLIDPNMTWQPTWTIEQEAATLWYHSHPHGETAQQVYRGAAGLLLIDDPKAADLGLPDAYGVDDIPLIVQDKSFTADGQMIVDPEGTASTGFLGDTIATNGTVGAYLGVSTSAVRLRLLNASNARVYNFGFEDDREFDMVASDGGLLAEPFTTDRVQLSPGERAEIVVRVDPGRPVRLNSTPPDLGVDPGRFGSGTFDVLELRPTSRLDSSRAIARTFAPLDTMSEDDVDERRHFRLSGTAINGRPMAMRRIDQTIEVDQVEVWEIANRDPQPHNFHVHGVQFQVLSVAGEPPGPELSGLKDTVYVPPHESVKILVRFTEHTDPQWPYMYHCHLLWHEDIGIMGQFVVVAPGQTADPSKLRDH